MRLKQEELEEKGEPEGNKRKERERQRVCRRGEKRALGVHQDLRDTGSGMAHPGNCMMEPGAGMPRPGLKSTTNALFSEGPSKEQTMCRFSCFCATRTYLLGTSSVAGAAEHRKNGHWHMPGEEMPRWTESTG